MFGLCMVGEKEGGAGAAQGGHEEVESGEDGAALQPGHLLVIRDLGPAVPAAVVAGPGGGGADQTRSPHQPLQLTQYLQQHMQGFFWSEGAFPT